MTISLMLVIMMLIQITHSNMGYDKPFFNQSVQYLEHLQQPFYSKFIAVSNHYPYSQFTNDEAGFPIAKPLTKQLMVTLQQRII